LQGKLLVFGLGLDQLLLGRLFPALGAFHIVIGGFPAIAHAPHRGRRLGAIRGEVTRVLKTDTRELSAAQGFLHGAELAGKLGLGPADQEGKHGGGERQGHGAAQADFAGNGHNFGRGKASDPARGFPRAFGFFIRWLLAALRIHVSFFRR